MNPNTSSEAKEVKVLYTVLTQLTNEEMSFTRKSADQYNHNSVENQFSSTVQKSTTNITKIFPEKENNISVVVISPDLLNNSETRGLLPKIDQIQSEIAGRKNLAERQLIVAVDRADSQDKLDPKYIEALKGKNIQIVEINSKENDLKQLHSALENVAEGVKFQKLAENFCVKMEEQIQASSISQETKVKLLNDITSLKEALKKGNYTQESMEKHCQEMLDIAKATNEMSKEKKGVFSNIIQGIKDFVAEIMTKKISEEMKESKMFTNHGEHVKDIHSFAQNLKSKKTPSNNIGR